MNGLERYLLKSRVTALRSLLPTEERLATARAEQDIPALREALRSHEAFIESATTLLEERGKPEEPIPYAAEPESLRGGLRLRGYVSTFGLRKDELLMRGYWADLPERVAAGIPLTWEHSTRHVLGRVETAEEDTHGLYATLLVYPPTNDWQQTIRDALAIGAVRSLSYFASIGTAMPAHVGRLREVTVTSRPADPNAHIEVVEPL